jgi:hypothetical protein
MVGNVIDGRISGHYVTSQTNINGSMLNESTPLTEMSGGWSAEDKEKIILSATLCLVVGIMQVIQNFISRRISRLTGNFQFFIPLQSDCIEKNIS